jgi:uncharacterized delta-60 repeat protein
MKTYLFRLLAFLFLSATFAQPTAAAPGDLDTGFNPNANGSIYATAVQPDGKIVIGGYFTTVGGATRNYIARLNADGTLDTSFNPTANNGVNCTIVQADGKIILGGQFTTIGGGTRNNLARLNADGTLDTTFNPNANVDVLCLALQTDGKIVVGGRFTTVGGVPRNRIARLNADGTLDTNFNPNANSEVHAVAVQADGKIVIGGIFTTIGGATRNSVARLNADGTLDTFNPNVNAIVDCIAVQADGKIVIGGNNFTTVGGVPRNRIARLNADGTLDTNFNPNALNAVYSLLVQTDGKIVIGGAFTSVSGATRNRVARLNPDGTLDTAFNPNANDLVLSLAAQADGKIILGGGFTSLGGTTRNRLARLVNDPATEGLTVPNASTVQWLRGGTSPESLQVTFELSTDNAITWTLLGSGTRIPGGWTLAGLGLPGSGHIRGRARTISGADSGSSGLVETIVAFSTCVPQVVVRGLSVTILDGDSTPTGGDNTDFFDVAICGGSKTHTFTIFNFGACPLTVTNITSSNPSEFQVGPISFPIVIPGGGSWSDFTVTFDPSGSGVRTTTLNIANNDSTANPYDFALSGNGLGASGPLVLACATNKTVQCGSAWTFDSPVATNLTLTVLNTVTNGTCPTIIIRTWQAIDACGNTNACSQTVTVLDTTPPAFTCPTNKTVQCGAIWTFDTPTATDNCSPATAAGPGFLPLTIINTVTNGTCPMVITRTWRATDACGNTNTCSQSVTVLGTTPVLLSVSGFANIFGSGHTTAPNPGGGGPGILPPSYSFPAGPGKVLRFSSITGTASLSVNLAFSGADGYLLNLPTDINSYGGISGIRHDGANFLVGVFLDSNPPGSLAPARLDFRVSALGTNFTQLAPAIGQSFFIGDGRTGTGLVQQFEVPPNATRLFLGFADAPGYQGDPGQYEDNGGSLAASFEIGETLACATNKTVECGVAWTFDPPTVVNGCGATNLTVTILSTVTNGVCPQVVVRTWQAVDACGNTNTCSQAVTVRDTTPSVFTCSTNKTVQCNAVWSFDPPTVSDSCSGTNVTITILSTVTNGVPCAQVITRTWQATDACGNTNTCSQTVNVVDTTTPANPCSTNNVILNTGYNHASAGLYPLGAVDAFWTVVADPDNGTTEPRPATAVTNYPGWLPAQASSQWISSYPTSVAPLSGAYDFETHFCLQPGWSNVVLNLCLLADDMAEVFVNGSPAVLTTPNPAYANLTCVVVTNQSLFANGSNVLRVRVHNTGAVAMGLNLTGSISSSGPSLSKAECCQPGSSVSGQKFNDLNGNGTRDAGEPGLPGWTIQLSPGNLSTVTDTQGYYYFQNLTPGTYTLNEQMQSCWIQTAPSNNLHTVTLGTAQSLNHLDFGNRRCQIQCATNKTVECGAAWSFDLPIASVACGGTNLSVTILNTVTNGLCPQAIMRTWRVIDACGNSNICSQTVTVLDTIPPILTCPTNKTVICGTAWTFDTPTATDNCSPSTAAGPGLLPVTILNTVTNGTCPMVITRTWRAADACGNTNICSQVVTVMNTSPPAVNCPTNKTVQCNSNWDFDLPTALSACSGTNVTITVLTNLTQSLTPCLKNLVRVWQVTDACSNSVTCSQVVTVFDTTPPVITCSSNKTVQCGSNWSFDLPTVADNCLSTNATLTIVGTVTNSINPLVITRTWQAADCNNNATCSQTVTVLCAPDPCPNPVNFVVNGSFEATSPVVTGTAFLNPTNGVPGWTTTTSNVLEIWSNNTGLPAFLGTNHLEINAQTADQTVSQTVTGLSTNCLATFCFNYAGRFGLSSNSYNNDFTVTLSGGHSLSVPLNPSLYSVGGWTNFCVSFLPTSSSITIAFRGKPHFPEPGGAHIDNVSLTQCCDTTPTNACVPAPTNMVLWLPLDETNGVTSINLVPGGNNGTQVNSPVVTSGLVANSLSFNGTNQYVNVPNYAAINPGAGDLSIDAWVRRATNSAPFSARVIVDKRDPVTFIGYSFMMVNSGNLLFQMTSSPGSFTNYQDTAIVPADNRWHLVAVTLSRSPTNSVVRFYLDGAPTAAWSTAAPPGSLNNTAPLRVGISSVPGPGSSPWLGGIDEVEVFNRALAAPEIQGLFNAGSAGKCKPPCATPFSINCATNRTVLCGSNWTFDPPTATSCCSTNVIITTLSTVTNGICPQLITRTWQASDSCGNTNTCSQTITVMDNTPPNLTCATNKTVNCDAVWTFDAPTASDSCSGTNVTITILSTATNGVCPRVITRTWRATDACTNSVTCSQTVTVLDTKAPILVCATNKTVNAGVAWSFDLPVASDSCSGTNVTVTILSTVTNGICPQLITRTWRATDACTNSVTCAQTVTLLGTSPANDLCANAIPVFAGVPAVCGTTACATASTAGSIPPVCGASASAPDVWYTFTPTCNGPVTIDTCGLCPGQTTTFDTVLSVYTGSCGSFTQVACNDDAGGGCGFQSRVTFNGTSGVAYRIRVAGWAGGSGPFRLNISSSATAPPNDNCAAAIPVSGGSSAVCGTTVCATPSAAGSIPPVCGASASAPDVWYSFTPTCNGPVTIDTCGLCPGQTTTFDSVLSVYTGSCGSFTQIACNDDAGGGCGLQSRVTFNGMAGVAYRIRVAGYLGSSGPFRLNISASNTPPPNDNCAAAIPVTIGSPAACGTTVCATPSAPGSIPVPCGASASAPDVWYSFTPTCNGSVTIDTCGLCPGQTATFDSVLSVYTGSCGSFTQVACNDDAGSGCGLQSRVTFNGLGGVTYRIRVAGFAGSSGPFRLNIAQTTTVPANDLCANATPIGNGTFGFNTCGANTDGPNQASIGCQPNQDVWFRFTASCSGQVTLDTCNSGFNTVLSVYTGVCGSLGLVTCNDNAATGNCAGGQNSFLTFNAISGTTYFIRVGGAGTATGSGLLTVQGPFPPFPTCPDPSGPSWTRLFKVMGPANNTPWSWSIGVPCCANFGNSNVPGLPVGSTANALAAAFAASINAACPNSGVTATASGVSGLFTVSVVNSCSPISTPFIFRIGPAGTLPQNQCVVADVTGFDPLPVTGACSFNPDLIELPLSGRDLNRNGVDDAIDLMTGASADLNNNGLPDESESCLPPQLSTKAESQVVQLGASVTLSVAATGTAPFTYRWNLAGVPLTDGGNISGVTKNVLTIQAVANANLGDYTVAVSNTCGTITTAPVTLSVEAPAVPVITRMEFLKGSFQLAVETKVGLTYMVEYKTNLSEPSWTPLETMAGDGLEHFVSDAGPMSTTRFYRVRTIAP